MTTTHPLIERIYITRGEAAFKDRGTLGGKYAGLVIAGKIYWIDTRFAHLFELSKLLKPLEVYFSEEGGSVKFFNNHRGFVPDNAPITSITKITAPVKAVFDDDSYYMKNTAFCSADNIWWSVNNIKNII